MNSNNKKIIRNLLIYLGIPILLVVLLLLLFDRGADQTGLKYSDVLSYFEDGKVSAYSLNLGTGEMKQQKGIRCALHGAEREPVLQRRFGLYQVV